MIKAALHFVLKLIVRSMDKSTERVFWLIVESAIKHKLLIALALVTNTIAAVFEGVSLAFMAMAISVLTNDLDNPIISKFILEFESLTGSTALIEANENLFFILIVMAIISQLIKAGLNFIGVALTIRLRSFAIVDMQGKMIKQIMSFSLAQVSKYPGGELTSYVRMSSSITSFLLIINSMISKVLMLISYLYLMFQLSEVLMAVSLVFSFIMAISLNRMLEKLRKYGQQVTKTGIAAGKSVMEFLTYPKFLRIYNKEDYATNTIMEQVEKGMYARRKGETLQAAIQPTFESVSIVITAGLLVGGYFLLVNTSSSPMSILLAFVLVFRKLASVISELNSDRANIANLMPRAEIVANVLKKNDKEFTKKDGKKVLEVKKGIILEDVEFFYPDSTLPAVSGVNLSIPIGSVVGIVGESGSGKTTLVDIILGLCYPSSGRVLIDGITSTEADMGSWRENFGVVSQDVAILNISIKDNLRLINSELSDKEIINASKKAHAHDFIVSRKDGYDTILGDRGLKLSGGQIQRIALTRAILHKSKILILDEATSALDSISEAQVIRAIKDLEDRYTIIQIAHRLATIASSDIIFVMDKGGVVERGSHQELIKKGGKYFEMWKLQIGDIN